jgi:hypothetical protein
MVPSATFVAVTVTVVDAVTEGAVNRPLLEMVPELACQVTAVLLVEVRVAENCCLLPEEIVAVAGERLILGFEGLEGDWFPKIPAQPRERQAKAARKIAVPTCLIKLADALPCW